MSTDTLPAPPPPSHPRRGRPPLDEASKRTLRLTVHLTAAEWSAVADAAGAAGSTVAAYVRSRLLAAPAGE